MSMRLYELDALRGLAAFSVVLFHYTYLYSERYGHIGTFPFSFGYGQYGVQLFFMISGFVIFLTLKKCKHHYDFIISRSTRIYPAYWVGVLLTAVVVNQSTFTDLHRTVGEIFLNLTMLQGYFNFRHVDGVYWTLMYELLFYAYMYVIYRLKSLDRIEPIIAIWLTLQLASVLINDFYGWFPWKVTLYLLLGYIHLFAAGILFLKLHQGDKSRYTLYLLGYCLALQWLKGDLTESFFVTGYFLLFLMFIRGNLSYLRASPLLFLGTISYPLYLIHQNIGFVLISVLERNNVPAPGSVLITIAAVLIISVLISQYIEKPGMAFMRTKLRRKVN